MNKLRRRMPVAFLVMLVVLLINAYITRVNTHALDANTQESAQSRRILLELTATLSTVKDAETGQRGFLLVGNDEYLQPYTSAVASIHDHLHDLQALTANNAVRKDDVEALSALINLKLAELAKTIELEHTQGLPAAVALVRTNSGKKIMDAIREKAGVMIAAENDHLTQLSQDARSSSRTRTYTFTLATLAGIACVMAAFMFVRMDILERERAAEEAERQRDLLSVTLTSVGDAVIATDKAGRVTFLNEVGEQVTGWTTAEAAGKRVEEVFHIINEQTRLPVESPAQKVLREGKIVGLANHTLLIKRDGSEIPIDDSGAPIRDRAGAVRGVIIVFRDVSEIKKVERAVRETEARFRLMADSAPVLIWIADVHRDSIWFNKPWLEFVGHTMSEQIGQGWMKGVHPDDVQKCLTTYANAFDAKQPFKIEYRLLRNDGAFRWLIAHGIPLYKETGEFDGFIGTCIDITERKELEEAREMSLGRERAARAQAETANRAKDEFLAVLSHELRTPLTPVLATIKLLQSEPNLEPRVQEDLEMIRRNAELEARLIDDLLDLTRVANNKVQLNFETVDAHTALRHVFEICSSEIDVKHQKVVLDFRAQRHHVKADAARLQQILWNLLKNASKFTPAGGTITIRTSNSPENHFRVDIQDTGIGIAPEAIDKLFNAFEQGDKRITRQFGGLGLGLAITKALALGHGGDVTAVSDGPGKGATFTLQLPVLDALTKSPERIESSSEPAPQKSLHILLVEDHADTLRTMTRLVKAMGHQVDTASTVASAVEKALANSYDLILSDIGLPDGNGFNLLQQVRKQKKTPAIALTGFGMEDDVRKSMEVGFSAHLTKPVNFDRLADLIRRLGTTGSSNEGMPHS